MSLPLKDHYYPLYPLPIVPDLLSCNSSIICTPCHVYLSIVLRPFYTCISLRSSTMVCILPRRCHTCHEPMTLAVSSKWIRRILFEKLRGDCTTGVWSPSQGTLKICASRSCSRPMNLMIDAPRTVGQDVDVDHQYSNVPEIPHPHCAEPSGRAIRYPWRQNCPIQKSVRDGLVIPSARIFRRRQHL